MLKKIYQRALPFLPALLVLGLAALAMQAVERLTEGVKYQDVLATLDAVTLMQVVGAAVFTLLSFAALAGYDAAGLAYLKVKVPLRSLALGSFAGYALGNTVGMGPVTGGAVRLRVYGAHGMDATGIAKLMAFISSGYGLGLTSMGAIGLLWGAEAAATILPFPVWFLKGVALFTFAFLAFVMWACWRGRPVRFGRYEMPLPSLQLAYAQLVVSALDILFGALALWVLLPDSPLSFVSFLGCYALALSIAIISHVPGGLGVFEAVMLIAFKGQLRVEEVAGALLLFRAIYYLAPLAIAILLLVLREWLVYSRGRVQEQSTELSPTFLSVATFLAGTLLLASAATPMVAGSLKVLQANIPLMVLELSHLISALCGLALLYFARGVLLRLKAAWVAAFVTTVLAAVLAAPKGMAFGEMLALGILLVLLLLSRAEFNRHAALNTHPFTLNWWLMAGAAVGASIWLLFFVYRDVPYSTALWAQSSFDSHAARSMRALAAVCLLIFLFAVRQAMRPASGTAQLPEAEALERALSIVQQQPKAEALMALMGDKSLLFSRSGRSFLMYAKKNRTWAALYDPIGEPAEFQELIWQFVELAHTNAGRACFYQASARALTQYADAGLAAHKLGDFASVQLSGFSLDGLGGAPHRQALAQAAESGLRFELRPAQSVDALFAPLKAVSDAWLQQQNSREKAFSMGAFRPSYLRHTPLALVWQGQRLVAFANVLHTELPTEAMVDLMRHDPSAPPEVMDFLFVHLLLWAKTAGFERFGLGMAPKAGMSTHNNPAHWHRIEQLIARHGAHFYNFRGVRDFKEKFHPTWEPRYLCADGSVKPLMAFSDIAALVAGSASAVIHRPYSSGSGG